MTNRTLVLAQSLFLIAGLAASSFAGQQDEAALKKDLTSVIALQGQPCGEVVAVTVLAQNDYAATCKDGNKYHVYENAKGRVVVEKQK
ncbi:MAG TPA: hypothetical protein VI485_02685 [Vicinamibacterales bacterium]|nr:hypothetical protein [Vicinamibacterales bacterium]